MRFLDLVEQHDRVGLAPHPLGELTALVVSDVPRRRADHLRHRVLLHVLAHVEAHQRLLAAEQELRQAAADLGLADPRGTEEHERPRRALGIADTEARAADGAADRLDGVILAHHVAAEDLFHLHQSLGLVAAQAGERNAGPRRDDVLDVALGDFEHALFFAAQAHALEVVAQIDLALAQVDRLLEILVRDRAFHLGHDLPDLPLQPAQILGVADPAELHLGARFVEHVDRLVRLLAVGDVARRLVDRRAQRRRGVAHLVERLVAILHALENLQRLRAGRGLHLDGLEAPQQRAVLLDVLAVLLERGRTDAGDLAARQRWFQDVGGVERALGRAGADQRVDLVDEDDDLVVVLELLEDALEPLLELAPVLGAGDDQRQIERHQLLLCQEDRHPALDDALSQPFDDRRFADPRLAQQDRVVLGAAREDLDDPLDLGVAADQRIEGALCRQQRQVAPVLGKEGQLLLLLRGLALLDDRADLLANVEQVEALLGQQPHRDATLDAEDADQQMLRADGRMEHALRFVRGVGEDLLRLLRERQLGRRGDALDEDALPFDLAAQVLRLHLEAAQELADGLLSLTQDAEQDVLGLDDPAAQLARFVAREKEGPTRFLVVLFEHLACSRWR